MPRCAFLTLANPPAFVIDDELAYQPLGALGWHVEAIPWTRSRVKWAEYDAVVIRSTWDYYKEPDRFLSVLESIERGGTCLFNPLELVRWNVRKTYLRDLHARGLSV